MDEWLPCPFCNGIDLSKERMGLANNMFYWIVCADCVTTGPHKPTEKEAVAAWNRRPRLAKYEAVVKAAEDYLHKTGNDFYRQDDGFLFYNLIVKDAGVLYACIEELGARK